MLTICVFDICPYPRLVDDRQTISKKLVELSATEKKEIEGYLKKLTRIKYYQISGVFDILNRIDHRGNNSIREWKQKLEYAVKSGNESLYYE